MAAARRPRAVRFAQSGSSTRARKNDSGSRPSTGQSSSSAQANASGSGVARSGASSSPRASRRQRGPSGPKRSESPRAGSAARSPSVARPQRCEEPAAVVVEAEGRKRQRCEGRRLFARGDDRQARARARDEERRPSRPGERRGERQVLRGRGVDDRAAEALGRRPHAAEAVEVEQDRLGGDDLDARRERAREHDQDLGVRQRRRRVQAAEHGRIRSVTPRPGGTPPRAARAGPRARRPRGRRAAGPVPARPTIPARAGWSASETPPGPQATCAAATRSSAVGLSSIVRARRIQLVPGSRCSSSAGTPARSSTTASKSPDPSTTPSAASVRGRASAPAAAQPQAPREVHPRLGRGRRVETVRRVDPRDERARPVARAARATASPVRPDEAGPWSSDSAPRGRPPASSPSRAAAPKDSGRRRRSSPRRGGACAERRRSRSRSSSELLRVDDIRFFFAIVPVPARRMSSLVPGRSRLLESPAMALDPEIEAYYARGGEPERLEHGYFPLERARTQEIVLRHLAPPPGVVLDVGGAAGAYALWLSARGYAVHLVDPVPLHVDEARRASAHSAHPLAGITQGDARALDHADASADAVLLLGPLYHLTDARGPAARAGRGPARPAAGRVPVRRRHLALRVARRQHHRAGRAARPAAAGLRGPGRAAHGAAGPRGRAAREHVGRGALLHDRVLPPSRRARGRGPRGRARARGAACRSRASAPSPRASRRCGPIPDGARRCSRSCGRSSASRRSSGSAPTSSPSRGGAERTC